MDRIRRHPIRRIRLLLKDEGGMAGPWKSERGGTSHNGIHRPSPKRNIEKINYKAPEWQESHP